MTQGKSEILQLRINPTDLEVVREYAKELDVPISEISREALVEYLGKRGRIITGEVDKRGGDRRSKRPRKPALADDLRTA